MTKLAISKLTEAKAIATIWNMGVESLDPESYISLEKILDLLCEIRSVNNEYISIEQKVLSGKNHHSANCKSNNVPVLIAGPCGCNGV